ncbi:MAG TPA: M48 family metallopeptidase [Terriglobales bacterium]|nr:M48 family metallopeptidase [Terriglobales bacterium]
MKFPKWMLAGVLASTLTTLPIFAKDNPKNDKNNPKDEPIPSYDKVKKGSIDDVNAIGNRDIGGRGLGNWYSIEHEVAMGKQYAQQVEQSAKLVTDPVVNEYINRIGQNIVRHSDAKVPFTIKVIDDDQINAFALPGGFFYINTGAILAADDESEVAGVMAHEIAHVAARHAMRQMTRAQWANFATIPLIFIGGGIGYAAYEAAGIGIPLTFMKFSRGFEAQADYLGTQYLYASGYDPTAMVDFFEKIEATEKKKPGALAKAFASHPATPDRVERTEEEIQKILPPKDEYVVTTSEFDQVKARLAAIENRRKVTDQDQNKPSLRRASTKTDGNSKSGDDDRPTLHRRDNDHND